MCVVNEHQINDHLKEDMFNTVSGDAEIIFFSVDKYPYEKLFMLTDVYIPVCMSVC